MAAAVDGLDHEVRKFVEFGSGQPQVSAQSSQESIPAVVSSLQYLHAAYNFRLSLLTGCLCDPQASCPMACARTAEHAHTSEQDIGQRHRTGGKDRGHPLVQVPSFGFRRAPAMPTPNWPCIAPRTGLHPTDLRSQSSTQTLIRPRLKLRRFRPSRICR